MLVKGVLGLGVNGGRSGKGKREESSVLSDDARGSFGDGWWQ